MRYKLFQKNMYFTEYELRNRNIINTKFIA